MQRQREEQDQHTALMKQYYETEKDMLVSQRDEAKEQLNLRLATEEGKSGVLESEVKLREQVNALEATNENLRCELFTALGAKGTFKAQATDAEQKLEMASQKMLVLELRSAEELNSRDERQRRIDELEEQRAQLEKRVSTAELEAKQATLASTEQVALKNQLLREREVELEQARSRIEMLKKQT